MDKFLFIVILVGLFTFSFVFIRRCFQQKNFIYRIYLRYLDKFLAQYSCEEFIFDDYIRIKQFIIRTNPENHKIPKLLFSFDYLQIETHFIEWWKLDFKNYLIVIFVEGLVVEVPELCFQEIMNPNKNAKSQTLPSFGIIHKMTTVFQICVENMSVVVGFPDIETKIFAQCTYFEATFCRHPVDRQSLVVTLKNVYDGHVEVIHEGVVAVDYYGLCAEIDVNIDIPTEKMCVEVFLKEKDSVRIRMDDFLKFFSKFQNCEDNAIEIKLTLGKSLTGKMKHLQIHIEDMCVIATDKRVKVPIAVNLENLYVGMKTTVLDSTYSSSERGTGQKRNSKMRRKNLVNRNSLNSINSTETVDEGVAGFNALKRATSSLFDYTPEYDILKDDYHTNVEKAMSVKIGNIKFLGPSKPCFVDNVGVNIVKVAVNSGDYIDNETMTIVVDSVTFGELDTIYMNWCLVAQQLGDQIPNSRFGHVKRDWMDLTVNHIDVSLSPFDNHLPQLMNSNNENKFLFDGSNDDTNSIQIISKDGITYRVRYLLDQCVRGVVNNLVLHKCKEARSLVSDMELSIDKTHLDIKYNAHSLEDKHNLTVGIHESISKKVLPLACRNDTPLTSITSLQSPSKAGAIKRKSATQRFFSSTPGASNDETKDSAMFYQEQCGEKSHSQSSFEPDTIIPKNYIVSIAIDVKAIGMEFSIGPAFVLNSVNIGDVFVFEETECFHLNDINDEEGRTNAEFEFHINSIQPELSSASVIRSQLFHMNEIFVSESNKKKSECKDGCTEMLVRMEKVTSSIGFSSLIKFLYSVSMAMDAQDRVLDKMDRMKAITTEQKVKDSALYKDEYLNNGACCCLLNHTDPPSSNNGVLYEFPLPPPKKKKEMIVKCTKIEVILYATENLLICMDPDKNCLPGQDNILLSQYEDRYRSKSSANQDSGVVSEKACDDICNNPPSEQASNWTHALLERLHLRKERGNDRKQATQDLRERISDTSGNNQSDGRKLSRGSVTETVIIPALKEVKAMSGKMQEASQRTISAVHCELSSLLKSRQESVIRPPSSMDTRDRQASLAALEETNPSGSILAKIKRKKLINNLANFFGSNEKNVRYYRNKDNDSHSTLTDVSINSNSTDNIEDGMVDNSPPKRSMARQEAVRVRPGVLLTDENRERTKTALDGAVDDSNGSEASVGDVAEVQQDVDIVHPVIFRKPEFFFEFRLEGFSWQTMEPKSSILFDRMVAWANTSSLYTEEFCTVDNFAMRSLDVVCAQSLYDCVNI